MNATSVFVVTMLALFALASSRCQANDAAGLADLQRELVQNLAKVDPEHKKEVEAYLSICEQIPETDDIDDKYKQAAIAYHKFKGPEEHVGQHVDLLDESCKDVREKLRGFLALCHFPDLNKSSEIARWAEADRACWRFQQTCSRSVVETEKDWVRRGLYVNLYERQNNWNEIHGLPLLGQKKPSLLTRMFGRSK